jgi:protease-4
MKRFLLWLLSVSVALFVGIFIASAFMGDVSNVVAGERVGVVEVSGFISEAAFTVKGLEEYAEDDEIKAVVVRVETPGGVVSPAQEIHDAVKRVAAIKPVICSFGPVAASGGYYLAAPATKIVSNPGSITGSIGVILQFQQYTVLMDKLGLRFEAIKSGPFKDTGTPFRELKESERKVLQTVVDDIFDQFVTAISEGRGMEKERVLELADGRIYTGRQALEVGLVDELGGFTEAVELAGALGGIVGKPRLQKWEKPEKGLLEILLGDGADAALSIVDPLTAPPLRFVLPGW